MMAEDELDAGILARYRVLAELGRGAYGVVWKAEERATGRHVALKKVIGAFNNDVDAQRTFREVYVLQHVSHKNIVRLLNVHRAKNDYDLYLVFEYMHADLSRVVYEGRILGDDHKAFIAFQLFAALLFLESLQVVHRDIKPANVLIDQDCRVKLADFGLSRSVARLPGDESDPVMTQYVATKLYRAPEVMLGSKHYSYPADIWSAGCIIAEIFMESPEVLMKSQSIVDQLLRYFSIFGKPAPEDLDSIEISRPLEVLKHLNAKEEIPLSKLLGRNEKDLLDLISSCLAFNPAKRITARQAIEHPFFKKSKIAYILQNVSVFRSAMPLEVHFREDVRLSAGQYRKELYRLVLEKKAEKAQHIETSKSVIPGRGRAADKSGIERD
jgi:mitogen-activated protein kinase 15